MICMVNYQQRFPSSLIALPSDSSTICRVDNAKYLFDCTTKNDGGKPLGWPSCIVRTLSTACTSTTGKRQIRDKWQTTWEECPQTTWEALFSFPPEMTRLPGRCWPSSRGNEAPGVIARRSRLGSRHRAGSACGWREPRPGGVDKRASKRAADASPSWMKSKAMNR